MKLVRSTPPVSAAVCLLVVLGFAFLGIFGRDPWKPDEAYTFGVVYHVWRTGELVVPTLAG